MKSALVFLLVMTLFTLFLEISTTPVDPTPRLAGVTQTDQALKTLARDKAALESLIAKVAALTGLADAALEEASCKIQSALKKALLQNSIQQFVSKAFDISNAALADAINAVARALAKKTIETCAQESLTQVLKWLKPLQGLSADVESTIDAALTKYGTAKDVQNAVDQLSAAAESVKVDLAKYIGILEQCPGKIVNRVKVVVKEEIEFILAYATANVGALSSLLPGAGDCGNACA